MLGFSVYWVGNGTVDHKFNVFHDFWTRNTNVGGLLT